MDNAMFELDWATEFSMAGRLLFAGLLGALVGLERLPQIVNVTDIHVWRLDDKNRVFDACIEFSDTDPNASKERVKTLMKDEFLVTHSVIESR